MKLSEAMLLGSIESEQGFSEFDNNPCAIRTALTAVNKLPAKYPGLIYITMWKEWPWTEFKTAIHPIKNETKGVTSIIYNLNDVAKWPRPKIAEWIATIEPQESTSNDLLEVEEQGESTGHLLPAPLARCSLK